MGAPPRRARLNDTCRSPATTHGLYLRSRPWRTTSGTWTAQLPRLESIEGIDGVRAKMIADARPLGFLGVGRRERRNRAVLTEKVRERAELAAAGTRRSKAITTRRAARVANAPAGDDEARTDSQEDDEDDDEHGRGPRRGASASTCGRTWRRIDAGNPRGQTRPQAPQSSSRPHDSRHASLIAHRGRLATQATTCNASVRIASAQNIVALSCIATSGADAATCVPYSARTTPMPTRTRAGRAGAATGRDNSWVGRAPYATSGKSGQSSARVDVDLDWRRGSAPIRCRAPCQGPCDGPVGLYGGPLWSGDAAAPRPVDSRAMHSRGRVRAEKSVTTRRRPAALRVVRSRLVRGA